MSIQRRVVNGVNTVVLHNKDYVEVSERLRILHELKKEFELIESQPYQVVDRWVWRVVAIIDGKRFVGNAEVKLANAMKGSPDSTNPFECAETSALGRALAFAGLGTVESIASYDEIARGQPATIVIEAAQDRSIDTPRQLAPTPDLKERVAALYKRAGKLSLFERVPSDASATQANFFKLVSEVLGANITSAGQMTASRLDDVEAYINGKDNAVSLVA